MPMWRWMFCSMWISSMSVRELVYLLRYHIVHRFFSTTQTILCKLHILVSISSLSNRVRLTVLRLFAYQTKFSIKFKNERKPEKKTKEIYSWTIVWSVASIKRKYHSMLDYRKNSQQKGACKSQWIKKSKIKKMKNLLFRDKYDFAVIRLSYSFFGVYQNLF